jgi:hypothetical protein
VVSFLLPVWYRLEVLMLEPGNTLGYWPVRLSLECNPARDDQFYLGSGADSAPEFETGADSLGAFTHSREPPMPTATCVEYLRVDSAAIIAHKDAEIPFCIL